MWPNSEAVAKRAGYLFADFKQGLDIQKYATTGQEDKRISGSKGKRGNSPGKTGGSTVGTKAANWKGTAQDEASHQTISSEVSQPAAKPKAQPDVMCGSHLKTPEDLTGFPTFPNGTKSLLLKHLSRDIWAKYAD